MAFEQAQVWADTILEGDYRAAGGTRLDQVDALQRNGMVVGYRIIYSEQAWELGTCGYYRSDEAHKPEALKACPEGRIYEASFVSPAFTTFIRDQGRYAQFQLAE